MNNAGHNNPPPDWYKPEEKEPPENRVLFGWFKVRHSGRNKLASFERRKISNGHLIVVEGHFLFDYGADLIKWTYAPETPEDFPNA